MNEKEAITFIVGNKMKKTGGRDEWISEDQKKRVVLVKNRLRFDVRSKIGNWAKFKSSYIANNIDKEDMTC